MSIARTYFVTRMADGDLARLCARQEDFFLENVPALDATITHIREMLDKAGLSSVVVHAPANPAPGFADLVYGLLPAAVPIAIAGLIRAFFRGAASMAGKRSDVTLRLTSNTSISVVFSRPLSSQ